MDPISFMSNSHKSRNDNTAMQCKKSHHPKKYQRLTVVTNVKGFVVNIHDAANFDIDLDIPHHLLYNYSSVVYNKYTYQDLGSDLTSVSVNNDELNSHNEPLEILSRKKEGKAYRCRLRGIGINQNNISKNPTFNSLWSIRVKQLIDENNGWITCDITDIDIYDRLLVDIYVDGYGEKKLNLRDFLLEKSKDQDIYYSYGKDKNRY